MKAVKIIIGIAIVLIAVVGIIIGVVYSQLDSLVEKAIEQVGSETLQTRVEVDGVSIKLQEGKGQITGIAIANPEGFSDASLAAVGDIGLQIDIESLTKKVKVIKEIYVDGVQLRAEHKEVSDTNIQALLDNLKSTSSSTGGSSSEKSNSSSPDVRLMVEQLRFGESQIVLESEKLGSRTIQLPAYTNANIGNKSEGLTPDELSQLIMQDLLKRVKSAVKKEIKSAANEKLKDKLKDKKEALKEKISSEKLKSLFN